MNNLTNIFISQTAIKPYRITSSDIKIKEITKLAEKIKWNDCFNRSYSGRKTKVLNTALSSCRVFVAIFDGKEVGSIRISNRTNTFARFFDGEVWNICEGYVKPPYRGKGIYTALRSYVVSNVPVKVMRIESSRYIAKKKYFAEQGFVFGYDVGDGYISILCTPDFLGALFAYNDFMRNSEH
jgi:hypothetical protein